MQGLMKKSLVCLLVAVLTVPFLLPAAAVAAGGTYDPETLSSDAMVADLLLCRPLGILASIAGGLLFVVSIPFSFSEPTPLDTATQLGVNVEKFIGEPIKYTFNRRIGDL